MGFKKAQKIEAQVVEAIRRLQTTQGSTPRDISNYISQEYSLPSTEVKRQVQVALKRGVAYGILHRMNGYIEMKRTLINNTLYGTLSSKSGKWQTEPHIVSLRCIGNSFL